MGLKAKCEIARKPENKVKNRYGNIVACKLRDTVVCKS